MKKRRFTILGVMSLIIAAFTIALLSQQNRYEARLEFELSSCASAEYSKGYEQGEQVHDKLAYDAGYNEGFVEGQSRYESFDDGYKKGYSLGFIDGFEGGYNFAQDEPYSNLNVPALDVYEGRKRFNDMVWVTAKGKRYHSSQGCSNVNAPEEIPRSEAEDMGYTPCSKCY